MAISIFDLFKVGIGPSSSHTVGPMRAARRFASELTEAQLSATSEITVELYGSLGATGRGHGTPKAIVLGLMGERPETVDPDVADEVVSAVRTSGVLVVLGCHPIRYTEDEHLSMRGRDRLPGHVNGMRFTAVDGRGETVASGDYYSVGGGFVVRGVPSQGVESQADPEADPKALWPFHSARELLAICAKQGWAFSDVVRENELASRSPEEVRDELLHIWRVMRECVEHGFTRAGTLPGGLGVRHRSADLLASLERSRAQDRPSGDMEWLTAWALAVNEENAAGGRVVTAPTNGAAGVVPAVLHYYREFVAGADDDGVMRFLLAAAAVGSLCKENASISGAEIGCQGEIGSACAMAAAGLTEVLGGTPGQVENAAEIAIEHNLGLTCDPVGGLVQIPCIERNAIAAVKAVAAARLALRGDGKHRVSLDQAIATMRQTGRDMMSKYKETSLGGLAVNVTEC